MNPHLLLRLPETAAQPVYWLLWANRELANGCWPDVQTFISDFADTRAEGVAFSELAATVLVPAAQVTTHSLSVEGRLTPTVRLSLPWRLEEELSEDVDNLHVAVLHHGNGLVYLAVTDKSAMAQWQDWLSQAHVHSTRWVSDALMLPFKENECRLLRINDLVIARHGQWQSAVCEPDWLLLLKEGLQKEQPELQFIETDADSPIAPLAHEASTTQLSLLQGQWQPSSPWRQRILPWLPTAFMASLLFILLTVNSLLEIRQLEQASEHYQQQAKATYLQLFPGERVVRLQTQMQQKLSALKQPDQRKQSMLSILARITPIIKAFPELKAKSMRYSMSNDGLRQTLYIQATASNFELFTQFRERFENDLNRGRESLGIAIEALERTEDKVTGTLVISGGVS